MARILFVLFLMLHCPGPGVFAQTEAVGGNIDSLKSVASGSALDSTKVLVLLELSEWQPSPDCAEKLRYAKEAAAVSGRIGWLKGAARSLNEIGLINKYCLKDYSAAIKAYEELVTLLTKKNATEQLDEAYTDLARVYQVTGRYSIAIDYYYKILKLTSDKSAVMSTLGNIGQIYAELGDYTQALGAYSRSLKILNDTIIADRRIPEGYLLMQSGLEMTMADLYIETGEYDKALHNYRSVLDVKNEEVRSMAYMGMGKSYFLKGETDQGISFYEKALQIARNNAHPLNQEEILDALANCYFEKKDIGRASDYALQAEVAAAKNKDAPGLIQIFTTLGRIGNFKKQYSQAVNYLNRAIGIAQTTGAKNLEKKAWAALSETYAGMKQPAKAFEAYKRFITLRDSVYNTEKAKELTRLDLQGAFDRKQAADSVKQADENRLTTLRIQRQRIMIYSGFSGVALMLLLAFFIYRNYSNARRSNVAISLANTKIRDEQQVSEELLLNILPAHVAAELKAKGSIEARRFDEVTILFTDFVNFTTVAEKLSPEELVAELHHCFKAFDEIIGKYRIEKIKTIGDAYLAAAGLPDANPDHATDVVKAAVEIRDFMQQRRQRMGDATFGIRLGINTGSVVAGIVGVKKFAYDIWGDTVNTAARMEQNSEAGRINISRTTYELVKDRFECNYRGEIEAKNKGALKMYFVENALT